MRSVFRFYNTLTIKIFILQHKNVFQLPFGVFGYKYLEIIAAAKKRQH